MWFYEGEREWEKSMMGRETDTTLDDEYEL